MPPGLRGRHFQHDDSPIHAPALSRIPTKSRHARLEVSNTSSAQVGEGLVRHFAVAVAVTLAVFGCPCREPRPRWSGRWPTRVSVAFGGIG